MSAAVTTAACSQASDRAFYSDVDDQKLQAARDLAVKTLPQFWAKFAANAPGYSAFLLKVGLPTDDGRGEEEIWMQVERRTDDGDAVGLLANQPFHLSKLHAGSRIEVAPSRFVDWSYTKDGKTYGQYSTRALYERASPEQRAEVDVKLAPTPLEPETN